MKTKIFLFFVLLLLSFRYSISNEAESPKNFISEGSLKVFVSPDLLPLANQWANDYQKQNPAVTFRIIETPESELAEQIVSEGEIGLLIQRATTKQIPSVWNIVVGRDIIVPVMSDRNPMLDEIYQKGISPEQLTNLLSNPKDRNWGSLLRSSSNLPIHFCLTADSSINAEVAEFLKINPTELTGLSFQNVQEMISAIQKDPNAIGFFRLIDVTDQQNQTLAAGLKLVPIDQNGNGKIDYMEDIYENLQSFSRGVWIGKYPKVLASKISLVTAEKLENPDQVAFVKWVLTDGQLYLSQNGFEELYYTEKQTQLAKFDVPLEYASIPSEKANSILFILLSVVFLIVLSGIVLDLIFRRYRTRKVDSDEHSAQFISVFDEQAVSVPKGLYFDKTHTWAFRRKNGSVKIGMDDFMQHVTGFITRVELKNAGDKIKKGEMLFSIIQQGKLLHIYSPVSGTILANNEKLKSNATLLNQAPYDEGWVYEIEPANWELEIQYLMLAEKFAEDLKNEFMRLKDFFASVFKPHSLEFAHAVLQEGGALKDHVLAELGPEVWEDFQIRFLDVSK